MFKKSFHRPTPAPVRIFPHATASIIMAYASNTNAELSPYFCAESGDLASSLFDAICLTVYDLFRFGFLHRWKHTRSWQD